MSFEFQDNVHIAAGAEVILTYKVGSPQHGIVLAVGPGLDWWGSVGVKMPVKPGDHVVFPASAGVWVEVEEERLLVCRVGQILGVLEEAEDLPDDALQAFEDEA